MVANHSLNTDTASYQQAEELHKKLFVIQKSTKLPFRFLGTNNKLE